MRLDYLTIFPDYLAPLGLSLPDIARWSERVTVALGQNPGAFTGPGTNPYLLGTGAQRILLDTGQGVDAYLPVLERALDEAYEANLIGKKCGA